jgi:C-terminal processing protease CtpA/Prc
MMRQVPSCKLIGDRTAGASGNPKPFNLGNGIILFVPSWKDLEPDGTCLEGRGVKPDFEVKTKAESNGEQDPVLVAALRFLRRKCPKRRKKFD